MNYALLDSGNEQKLEQFGPYSLIRPCSQALWQPLRSSWKDADGYFTREEGNKWVMRKKLPASWVIELNNLRFKLAPTDFGHVGLFPEHSFLWDWFSTLTLARKKKPRILNLFAYSGGATLAAVRAGAEVCHLDASKGMVQWARDNAALNGMEKAPIRWIVEDVLKFLGREIKRGSTYEGIILDPPSFGRGSQGEMFKIERDIQKLLHSCRQLLSKEPLFVLFSSHTPGMTPLVLRHLMVQMMQGLGGEIENAEMVIKSSSAFDLPSGAFARWSV